MNRRLMQIGVVCLGVGLVWAVGIMGGVSIYRHYHPLPEAVIVPSAQFLADWDSFQAESKAIDAEQDRVNRLPDNVSLQQHKDQLIGHLKRLQDQIPAGYTFVADKRQLIKTGK